MSAEKQKAWAKSHRKPATAAYLLLLLIFLVNLDPQRRGDWKREEKCKLGKILQQLVDVTEQIYTICKAKKKQASQLICQSN